MKNEGQPFSYQIAADKFGRGYVAFLKWRSAEGEESLVGTLKGFAEKADLEEAAKSCVAAMQHIGFWANETERA